VKFLFYLHTYFKLRITHKMISEMDKERKWKNVNNEAGSNNYKKQDNKLKRAQTRPRGNILTEYATGS